MHQLLLPIFKFASVIVYFSELILAELSSASESIQPGLPYYRKLTMHFINVILQNSC